MTREQMIQRMQQAQARLVKEVWDRRMPDLPIRSPEQLVTLASIIEKETGKPEERTRVAAVFMNRLKQNMRLQSDPTIIYGLVGGKGSLGRPIMSSEIEQPTPYNTYVDQRPAAGTDRQSRPRVARSGGQRRRAPRNSSLSPTAPAGMPLPTITTQHQKNVARLRVLEQGAERQCRAAVRPYQPPTAAPATQTPHLRRHCTRAARDAEQQHRRAFLGAGPGRRAAAIAHDPESGTGFRERSCASEIRARL